MRIRLFAAAIVALGVTACGHGSGSAAGSRPAAATSAAPAPAVTPLALPTAVPAGRRHGMLTALGESITSGIASTSPAHAYPALAGDLLATNVTNLGRPIVSTDAVLALEVPRIPAATTRVVIDVGTIDASDAATNVPPAVARTNAQRLEPAFDRLIASVRQRAPRAKIAVVTVRDLGRAGIDEPDHSSASLSAAVHEWNAHEKRVAAANGIAVVDTETSPDWYVKSDYDAGQIHPTDAGALRLAKSVAAALRSAPVSVSASRATLPNAASASAAPRRAL